MSKNKKSVLLATDGTINIQIDALANGLSQVCKYIQFESRSTPFDLGTDLLSNPATYKHIEDLTNPLLENHSLILIASELPYDNNYFMDSDGNVIISSVWGWDMLTNLPKTNGMIGFVDNLLAQNLDDSVRHVENTGCIYDFLWDKSGVDARLRSGVICRDCLSRVQERAIKQPNTKLDQFDCTMAEGLEDLLTILDEVSQASKRGVDILNRWQTKAGVPQKFDVFLCHNSNDKPSVRNLYEELKKLGISPWFDEEHLCPGRPWQRELEEMIPQIKTAAVVVGPHGQGPWQDRELDAFISEFVRRGCPVIPVLLEDAGDTPTLPMLLRAFTWVDFRKTKPDPLERLVWGITGNKPA